MTDPIKTLTGTLTIRRTNEPGKTFVLVSKEDNGERLGIRVPATALIAAIDRAEPDAMRAYLRETVEREVPEADSPEDVDERVPPREALLTDAQERRLYLIEQLTKTMPADEAPALAHWIITGGMDVLEDLTLSGEDLNR